MFSFAPLPRAMILSYKTHTLSSLFFLPLLFLFNLFYAVRVPGPYSVVMYLKTRSRLGFLFLQNKFATIPEMC